MTPSLKVTAFNGEFNGHASFIISLKGFVYALISQNRIVALEDNRCEKLPTYEHLCSQIKNFILISEIKNSLSVSVGIHNEFSTLVPSALFDENKKQDILKFNFRREHLSASSDFLQTADAYNVYDCPEIIRKTFNGIFRKTKFFHFSTPLIESLLTENKFSSETRTYLHFFQKEPKSSRFELLVIKNSQLIFLNSFYFQEKEDVAYYLLYALEQLKLNPEKTEVTVLGEIQKTDEILSLLENYVQSVKFGLHPGNFEFPKEFDEVPSHFYYSLLSQYLCA